MNKADEPLFPTDPRVIAWSVIGTLGGVLLIFVALSYLLFADPEQPAEPARPNYAQIRQEMRMQAEYDLTHYGWVDREKGVVRIPIEAAIAKVIAEGSK
ncbi:MAG: hypothetical protein ACYTGZ_06070 [Planctomycetota bacterium]